ncbi:MAG TPA: hypothetical protein PK887_09885 [Ignavibacteriales bacterium]|jgi:hypothetical protein|nr:hypothetical protein [Ignavibacteriales bacterium]
MAKQQSFGDKAKKQKPTWVNVKVVRSVKTENNTWKFQEGFQRVDDISKVGEIK